MMQEMATPFGDYDEAARMMYMNSLLNGLFERRNLLLVAEEDGILYGFVQLTITVKPYGVKPSALFLHRYVDKSKRNTDMSSEFQSLANEWAAPMQVPLVEVFVPLDKVKVYERLGFKAAFVQMYKPFKLE